MKSYLEITNLKSAFSEEESRRYNAIIERLGWKDKKLSEIEEEALIEMTCNIPMLMGEEYEDYLEHNYDVKGIYHAIKRIESSDIGWLFLWKRAYEKERDKAIRNAYLAWAVEQLTIYDLRVLYDIDCFRNARHSFDEIHKDYARVLCVTANEISSAIECLISQGKMLKFREFIDNYSTPDQDDYFDKLDGVVYIPTRLARNLSFDFRYCYMKPDDQWITDFYKTNDR